MGLQLLAFMVELVLKLLLLHLQRHQLLALQVRHVVRGGGRVGRSGVALRGGDAPIRLVPPLVFLVVEGSKGEDVQKEEGGAHSDGNAQLCGVIPFGLDHHC